MKFGGYKMMMTDISIIHHLNVLQWHSGIGNFYKLGHVRRGVPHAQVFRIAINHRHK